mgnify:CR=1 FL=1
MALTRKTPVHRPVRALAALALAAATVGFAPAQAAVLFTDNFDDDALALNAITFVRGWTVTAGSVDVHGAGDYWDMHPGNGHYVDLDGSTMAGGTLARSFTLDAGITYSASWWLGGSGRGDANTVDVMFGTSSASYTLASNDPLALAGFLNFTPLTSGDYTLSFTNRGGDNLGAILDNVVVQTVQGGQTVPEPGTLGLALAAAGLMAGLRRRRG